MRTSVNGRRMASPLAFSVEDGADPPPLDPGDAADPANGGEVAAVTTGATTPRPPAAITRSPQVVQKRSLTSTPAPHAAHDAPLAVVVGSDRSVVPQLVQN